VSAELESESELIVNCASPVEETCKFDVGLAVPIPTLLLAELTKKVFISTVKLSLITPLPFTSKSVKIVKFCWVTFNEEIFTKKPC